jgi:hypothetical protein
MAYRILNVSISYSTHRGASWLLTLLTAVPPCPLTCLLLQVREVLEGYLDDDQDMKDMNITAKEQHALQVRWGAAQG